MKPKNQLKILKGIQIFAEGRTIDSGYIKIENEKIVEFGIADKLLKSDEYEIIDLPSNYKAIPGFIDLHIHGVDGADTMDGTKEALDTMSAALPREGTTSYLATTITQEVQQIEAAVINAGQYLAKHQTTGMAEILGIHLEGPFVSPKKAGAQPILHILDPDIELLKKWESLSNGTIRIVTLAPEQPGGLEMIQYLNEHGMIASIGHTDALYAEVIAAMNAGASHVTHLFNQMRGLHHREPGAVGAAFLRDELKVELIADGVHVLPEMVNLAYKLKRKEGLMLITDSMRAKCLKNGHYDLGGQDVTVRDGKAVLKDGTLAGSILRMNHAVKNIQIFTGCSIEAAIEMASVNPAKQLNVFDRKGSIEAGKDADIVILDENSEPFLTICRGKVAYKRLT